MPSQELLIDAFGRIKEVVHDTLDGLDIEALVFRPGTQANSIAWLVWHLTRIQDDHLAELRGAEQVWTSEGWCKKLTLPLPDSDTGYGHSDKEVAQVRADATQLVGYHDAVYAETVKFIQTLREDDYDKVVDENWDPPVTMAIRLISVVSDDLQHAGQAAYIRGLIES